MGKKYNLEKMLREIQEDENLDMEEHTEISQAKIHQIMMQTLRKRKAQKE